jgi:hypothetical protein
MRKKVNAKYVKKIKVDDGLEKLKFKAPPKISCEQQSIFTISNYGDCNDKCNVIKNIKNISKWVNEPLS